MRVLAMVIVACGGMLVDLAVHAAEPLETLFYSPTERRAIMADRRKQDGEQFNFKTSLSVKGLVKRATGKGSIWINDQTIPEGQAALSGGVPKAVGKAVAVEGQTIKVGETVDVESGQRIDVVPEGAIKVRR